jgi:hypothetical protein
MTNSSQTGVGVPRSGAGEGRSPSTLGAAQAAHPTSDRGGGAARRDPAQQGWGPDGSAGGAGAQPPFKPPKRHFFS